MTDTIVALGILLAIGAFVVFALFPRRGSPKSEGSAADTNYSGYAAGAPDSHHGGDGGGHSAH